MAQSNVLGAAGKADVVSDSPSKAMIFMALAGVCALGLTLFGELYGWGVSVVVALIGFAAAGLLAAGMHKVALAVMCLFMVAVMVPMVGALAFIIGPFLSSAQGGQATFATFISLCVDIIVAGGASVFLAAMALKSFPGAAVEKYFSFGIVTTPRFIIGSMILTGIAINFANIIGRYLFLAPIIWAEEIMIYIMVWMVFVGSVLVTWDNHHLKMDFFSIMLPSPFKEIMNFTAAIAFIVACLFVLPQAHTVTNMMYDLDQRSVVAEAPMVAPHFALLLGFALMLVAVVFRFRRIVSGTLASEVDDLVAATEAEGGKTKD